MISISDSLLRCSLFQGVDAADLSSMLICLCARQVNYVKGETIIAEGAPAKDVGLLISGQVQLIRTD